MFNLSILFTLISLISSIHAFPTDSSPGDLYERQTTSITGTSCPKYMVIEAPGLGDINGYWTGPTSEAILAGLSGGVRYNLKTPPPADSGPNSNGEQLVTQAAKGSLEIVQVVAENFAQCPDIKFVLFGYSYGTIEVVLATNNPALLRPPIAAVIMYGNCFWHPDREENRGTATSGQSVCGGIGQARAGLPLLYEGIANDYCLVHDYLCTGSSYTASDNSHWSYKNSQWQADAVSWAIQRLKSDGLNL